MNEQNDDPPQSTAIIPSGDGGALITRSRVEPRLPYKEYLQPLRHDFFYSCAYCTMSESEGMAIRFTIDHYEPQRARSDLVNEYTNLMYACGQCNSLKGDRCPPDEARVMGFMFIRPDKELYSDHFVLNGLRLDSKSNTGEYSIQAIDLNRKALQTIRSLRMRLDNCERLIVDGVAGLRRFHIDRLPMQLKGKVVSVVANTVEYVQRHADQIDALLRRHARSPLIDPDPESEKRAKERAQKLNDWKGLHPGSWRGRNIMDNAVKPSGTKKKRGKKRGKKRRT